MDEAAKLGVTFLGSLLAGAVLAAALLLFKDKEREPLPDVEDIFPEPDPLDLQPHMVFCMAPWGQMVNMFFSADEWQMLHQLVKMSGDSLDSILCEIAAQRYEDPRDD